MSQIRVNNGDRYGRLVVVRECERKRPKIRQFECLCDCGNTTRVSLGNLRNGHTTSCGCSNRLNINKGERFGRLTVIEEVGHIPPDGRRFKCLCDCGSYIITAPSRLKSGGVLSCGCISREKRVEILTKHGLRYHPLYRRWSNMKHRCSSPNDKKYEIYGGRGIKVCDEWKNDFKAFYDWSIANGYEEGLTLDRINVDGDYEPSNCRWATLDVQNNNKRNNHYITIDGETKTLAQWCRVYCIEARTVRQRMRDFGWDYTKAITHNNKHLFNGRMMHLTEICREIGLNYGTFRTRIYSLGWSVDKALSTPAKPYNKKPKADSNGK